MKKIEIVDVVINTLNSHQDMTGEYNTNCDVDFMLSEQIQFNIFNKEYVIDRVKMGVKWDVVTVEYAQKDKVFCCFPVSKIFVHKVLNRVIQEQKGGVLSGWMFADDLFEILTDENELANCYY